MDIILASRGDWAFPVVRGVLTTPTLRPDGSLLVKPGYDPMSRYYLAFPSNLTMPPIRDAPTRDEALAFSPGWTGCSTAMPSSKTTG